MLAPALVGLFALFTMNAFDLVFWALLWWLAVRYLRTGNERLWLAFGFVAGVGLENKVSVLFLGFGVVCGLVVCRRWDAFRSRWLWIGGAVAGLLFLPHLLWQVANGWPTLEFVRNALARKNVALSPAAFLGAQAINTFRTLPVWMAGLGFLLFAKVARPFRPARLGLPGGRRCHADDQCQAVLSRPRIHRAVRCRGRRPRGSLR